MVGAWKRRGRPGEGHRAWSKAEAGSSHVHLGQDHGSPVGIRQDDESSPRRLLGLPQHRRTLSGRVLLPGIGIRHRETQSGRAGGVTGRKDAPFVMATVVTMEDDAVGAVPDHGDDLVLEEHGQPEQLRVERPGLGKARHIEDQALELLDAHRSHHTSCSTTFRLCA